MREARVPREVRRRVKRYYADVWVQRQEALDVGAFYSELPHSLRTGGSSAGRGMAGQGGQQCSSQLGDGWQRQGLAYGLAYGQGLWAAHVHVKAAAHQL